MALSVEVIDDAQAERVIHIEEGQFSDVKAASISPSKLSHTISAFANSDGGELFIGIGEDRQGGGVKVRTWDGFADVEAANGHLQSFERLFPLGTDFHFSFLRSASRQGLVLHVEVARTQPIMKAADGILMCDVAHKACLWWRQKSSVVWSTRRVWRLSKANL